MKKKSIKGLTLIELAIGVAIVGIITMISVGSYTSYVRRARRVQAIDSLLAISLAQERYRAVNTTYAALASLPGYGTSIPFYTFAVTSNTATGYTVTATATGDQVNDSVSGTSCATLTVTVLNFSVTRTPAACWPT